jgi:hypothetical protein
MRTLVERLEEKIDFPDDGSGCWLWTGAKYENGYGKVRVGGIVLLAHRVVYELLVGPIPPGLQVDHVRERGCLHRHCVNPDHMEPVTCGENVRRGQTGRRKSHCPQGHSYAEHGRSRGRRSGRYCVLCKSETERRARANASR